MKIINTIKNDLLHYGKLYAIILSIILISDDCYWFSTATNPLLISFKYAFLVVLPICLYFSLGRPKINILEILFMSALFCLSAAFGEASLIGGPATLFFLLLSSSILVRTVRLQIFARAFIKIVLVMMLYSLCIWVALMTDIMSYKEVDNVIGATIKTAGFCTFFNDNVGLFLRNGCFFREPGVFMVFINIAFILDALFLKNNIGLNKLVLYAVCMLTTLSTAGVIIMFGVFILYLQGQAKNYKSLIVSALFFMLCIYLLVGSEELMNNVFGKLEHGMSSNSVVGRITSLTIPGAIILNNPLLGVGAARFRGEYISFGREMYHMHIDPQGLSTNTILNAGAVYGLWFTLFIIIGFFKFSKTLSSSKFTQTIGVFLLFMMLFSNESMFYSMLVYILIFYGRNYGKTRGLDSQYSNC